jgi:hypothetical protein
MKTFTCTTCSAKKIPASEMHLDWKICAACQAADKAASRARVEAEEVTSAARRAINDAATIAAFNAAQAARTPEQKAAADAYDIARSESQAQQAAAHRAADYGAGDHISDDRAHREGSDDIRVTR